MNEQILIQKEKQSIWDILRLLKLANCKKLNKYSLLYDSDHDYFFIHGMDLTNITLLNTSEINLANNKSLYEYGSLKWDTDVSQIVNYLIKEKELNYSMVKNEYNEYILNINNNSLILEFNKIDLFKEPEGCINLEYKNIKLNISELKQLLKLKKDISFNLKSNSLKLIADSINKTFETTKSIYIDFENKYPYISLNYFMVQVLNNFKYNKDDFLYMDISRDAPICLKTQDNKIKYYIAPKITN